MKGGGLKVLSAVEERILTHHPSPPSNDSTSLNLQYKQISVFMPVVAEVVEKIVFSGIVVEARLSTC